MEHLLRGRGSHCFVASLAGHPRLPQYQRPSLNLPKVLLNKTPPAYAKAKLLRPTPQIPRIKVAPTVLKRRPIPSFVPSPTDDERVPPRHPADPRRERDLSERTDHSNCISNDITPASNHEHEHDSRAQRGPFSDSLSYHQPTSRLPLDFRGSSAFHGIVEMLDSDDPTKFHSQRDAELPSTSNSLPPRTVLPTRDDSLSVSHTKSLRTTLGIILPPNKSSLHTTPANLPLSASLANLGHQPATTNVYSNSSLSHRPNISPSISTRAVASGSQLSLPSPGDNPGDVFADRSLSISPLLHRSSLRDGASIYSPLTLSHRAGSPREYSGPTSLRSRDAVSDEYGDGKMVAGQHQTTTRSGARSGRTIPESGDRPPCCSASKP